MIFIANLLLIILLRVRPLGSKAQKRRKNKDSLLCSVCPTPTPGSVIIQDVYQKVGPIKQIENESPFPSVKSLGTSRATISVTTQSNSRNPAFRNKILCTHCTNLIYTYKSEYQTPPRRTDKQRSWLFHLSFSLLISQLLSFLASLSLSLSALLFPQHDIIIIMYAAQQS